MYIVRIYHDLKGMWFDKIQNKILYNFTTSVPKRLLSYYNALHVMFAKHSASIFTLRKLNLRTNKTCNGI